MTTPSNSALPTTPLVGIVMGSKSDLPTMQGVADTLKLLNIPHEMRVMSAHRTPELTADYAQSAERRGLQVIIAGAGGAAHLAGVMASMTVLPVLGVPMQTSSLNGLDSLLSTVQMPGGVPVATFAIGKAGAVNAGIFAAQIIAAKFPEVRDRIRDYRETNRQKIINEKLD